MPGSLAIPAPSCVIRGFGIQAMSWQCLFNQLDLYQVSMWYSLPSCFWINCQMHPDFLQGRITVKSTIHLGITDIIPRSRNTLIYQSSTWMNQLRRSLRSSGSPGGPRFNASMLMRSFIWNVFWVSSERKAFVLRKSFNLMYFVHSSADSNTLI